MRNYVGKLVVPGVMATLALCLAGCGRPTADPNVLSKPLLTSLIAPQVDGSDQQWCMNTAKIKYSGNNQPIGDGPPPADGASGSDNSSAATQNGASADPVSADGFPLILAEEAFIRWSDQDVYVMSLLIGGGFIAVHNGGYPQSLNEPGSPGSVYQPENLDQVQAVVADIRERGAIIDLTDKGRSAGVYDSTNGFCAIGSWAVNDVTWTTPATDAKGNYVSHVTASLGFEAHRLGAATTDINPMQLQQIETRQYTVAKFNDGWKLVPDDQSQPQQAPAQPGSADTSQNNSNTNQDDGGLAGALLTHKLLTDHNGDNDNENDGNSNGENNNGDSSNDNNSDSGGDDN